MGPAKYENETEPIPDPPKLLNVAEITPLNYKPSKAKLETNESE